jgi:hypothetical protein
MRFIEGPVLSRDVSAMMDVNSLSKFMPAAGATRSLGKAFCPGG